MVVDKLIDRTGIYCEALHVGIFDSVPDSARKGVAVYHEIGSAVILRNAGQQWFGDSEGVVLTRYNSICVGKFFLSCFPRFRC